MNATTKLYTNWSSEARDEFERIIAVYGGWKAWNDLESVTFKLREFRGGLVFVKGLGRSFFKPDKISVNPKTRQVDFYYGPRVDTFKNGEVSGIDGRSYFKKTTFEQWGPGHSAYFFGYAWANYISYPFNLPQFELLDYKIQKTGSEFKIRFPDNYHTHCPEQIFYFNENKMLFRHDYHAPMAGPFVYGAHCTEAFIKHQNIIFPTVRKVYPKVFGMVLP
ncbi:MAG: hypothetical protein ACXVAX_05910, partial [Pseudobdellovibrio sp.]